MWDFSMPDTTRIFPKQSRTLMFSVIKFRFSCSRGSLDCDALCQPNALFAIPRAVME